MPLFLPRRDDKAVEAVIDGEVIIPSPWYGGPDTMPPSNEQLGFCIFNNVAIAAKYALATYKLERIAIIDFDVHHGNGTQEAFYNDPHVLYISTINFHTIRFGRVEETGAGDAKGTKMNIRYRLPVVTQSTPRVLTK